NGIDVKNGVAVFDPGLYWLETNTSNCSSTKQYALCLEANSYVRPSFYTGGYVGVTAPSWFSYNDGTHVDGGTVFYFHGIGSVVVDSNSGSGGGTTPDNFGGNAWQFASANATLMAACPNGGTQ